MEYIGSGLVDRHGARIGRRIGFFLSYVQLQGLKSVIAHGILSFSFLSVTASRAVHCLFTKRMPGGLFETPGHMT